ncbi:EAL domain-containing response regulator [Cupriavidus plantarum]|uniref:EAL domain-containing response regulator n=1 Tax=Cupriavidus plantarum TaxID=942865 RepID=UPI000EB3DA8B|nr:EAL domain-containing protein [Cupriavidus plantarum]RLK45109.1 EAL domain-containing protein (putative c-di-GMP-specific phosphodiesterase class I) [Cupriavidus plantarum]
MPPVAAELRILVVDDDPFQRTVAADQLRALGIAQIDFAANGLEAADRLAATAFDAVLCDIEMPVANGPELVAELGRRGIHALAGPPPVWGWLTALPDDILDSHRDLVLALGFPRVHALHKPLERDALVPVIDDAIVRHKDPPRHDSTPKPAAPDDAAILAAVLAMRVADSVTEAADTGAGHFDIEWQPQFDIATGRIAGAEALCRWHHPTLGRVPPDVFIPRLEALDAADPILFLATERCLSVQQQLTAAGVDIPLGINASAQTLCRPGVLDRFEHMVATAGLPRRLLTVELTEGFPVADTVALSVALNRLRVMGYGVAIDDFGVGIATLKLLADLPFTQIKLDRSFVSSVNGNSQRAVICRNIIRLALDLGLECIAEGIETEAQRAALLALGCHLGQGYLWSRPLARDAFLARALA